MTRLSGDRTERMRDTGDMPRERKGSLRFRKKVEEARILLEIAQVVEAISRQEDVKSKLDAARRPEQAHGH